MHYEHEPSRDPAQTRALLIEAAGPVFARLGLAGTRAEDVAAAAGLTVEDVHAQFAGPEELLIEVLTSQAEQRVAEANWLVDSSPTDRREAAAALSRLIIAVADKDADTAERRFGRGSEHLVDRRHPCLDVADEPILLLRIVGPYR